MPKATGKARQMTHQEGDTEPYPQSKQDLRETKAGSAIKRSRSRRQDPKQSHLYTNDNPSTTLHGTGFRDAQTAHRTIDLVSQRSLTYQWQVINTMYHRAKGHPSIKKGQDVKGIKAAMEIFDAWLKETYPNAKAIKQAEGKDFKPLLKKETVSKYLSRIRALEADSRPGIRDALADCKAFAEMYAVLPKGKRLANTLLDNEHPEEQDWEIRREQALTILTDGRQGDGERDLWNERGGASDFHAECIGWAWSPVGERRLPP